MAPTTVPTVLPTQAPTTGPTLFPTESPSLAPTGNPTVTPTQGPTPIPPYPRIESLEVTSQATVISVSAELTLPGFIWCAAYEAATLASSPSGAAVKARAFLPEATVKAPDGNVTASYNITGLLPLREYSVFCYTEDSSKPAWGLTDRLVAGSRVDTTTQCCFSVDRPTLPLDLYEDSPSSVITYAVDTLGVAVTVTVTSCGDGSLEASNCTESALLANATSLADACSTAVSEDTFRVNPSTNLTFASQVTARRSIYAQASDCYLLSYSLWGSRSLDFFVPEPQLMYIFPSGKPLAAPSILSARFTDAASAVRITLGAPCNQGKLSGTFACSRLLRFRGVESSTCFWADSATLMVKLSASSVIVPGNNVTLRAGTIKAACSGSKAFCRTWPANQESAMIVAGPTKPLLPSASLVYASTISRCSDLVVDASGSTGGGGRPLFFYWTITQQRAGSSFYGPASSPLLRYLATVNYNASALGRGLSRTEYGASRLDIPSEYLEASTTYRVIVSLTSFLGATQDSAPAYVAVTPGRAAPTVQLKPSFLSVYRSDVALVMADAFMPSCSEARTLAFNWTESSGAVVSTSLDPRYFRAEADTLVIGRTYSLIVTVADDLGGRTTASATVYVESAPLVMRVAGGDRAIGASTALVLDASSSYDPDAGVASGPSLAYAWSCIMGGINYGKECSVPPRAMRTGGSQLSTGRLREGIYIFTVTGTKGSRSLAASVTITVRGGNPPLLAATAKATGVVTTKVNPSAKLTIRAFVDYSNCTYDDGSINSTLTWSLLRGTLERGADLDSVALAAGSTQMSTVLTREYLDTIGTASVPFPLIISPGSLVGGSSYTFRLAATDNLDTSSSRTAFTDVTLTVNAPPASGTFSVSPRRGYVLTTKFSLALNNWADDLEDFPLRYSFEYRFPSDPLAVKYVLAFDALASYLTGASLPANPAPSSSNVTLIGAVADRHGASTSVSVNVTVLPLPLDSGGMSGLSGNVTDLLDSVLGSYNLDSAVQVLSASATLINDPTNCPVGQGGANCSALRASLLGYMATVAGVQNPSERAVEQQVGLLSLLVATPEDAAAVGAAACGVLSGITAAGSMVGISAATAGVIGTTMDALFEAMKANNESAASLGNDLSASIDNLARGVWTSLDAGDAPVVMQGANLNVSTARYYAFGLQNTSLAPPGLNNSVKLPSDGITCLFGEVGSTDEVSVSVASMASPHNATNPLSSQVMRFSASFNGSTSGSGARRRLLAQGGSTLHARGLLAPTAAPTAGGQLGVALQTNSPIDYTVSGCLRVYPAPVSPR
jgi:hypothetical protein